jgi:predicted acetyltransferase
MKEKYDYDYDLTLTSNDYLKIRALQATFEKWLELEPKKSFSKILKEKEFHCLSYMAVNPQTTPDQLIRFLIEINYEISSFTEK